LGYTHYWRRVREFQREPFRRVVGDFRKLVPALRDLGVRLAGGDGTGSPVLNEDEVVFNGARDCGHPKEDLGIAWPSDRAAGVGTVLIGGTWFGGALLERRACGGDCSHETFYLPRAIRPEELGPVLGEPDKFGRYFDFCKTAYKPYDLAVTAALVIAKHHLGDAILVSSDGEARHWLDAVLLCADKLGYGADFVLDG